MELHRRAWMAVAAVAGGLALVGVARERPAVAQPVTPPQRPGPKLAVCPTGQKVCGAACVAIDVDHGCGNEACTPCAHLQANVEKARCVRGPAAATICGYTACKPGWLDDDGDVANGCETRVLGGFTVTPSGAAEITREQVVGGDLAVYTIQTAGNDIHVVDADGQRARSAAIFLAVPIAQDEAIRRCLDQPFTAFGLSLPTGRGSLRQGPVAVDGARFDAVRPRDVRVSCTRRFPAPPPPVF